MIALGINYSRMHDSSACLARDGQILFAVAEERLSRIKHDAEFPARSIQACLDFAGIAPDDLDEVCFGWPRPHTLFLNDLSCYIRGRQPVNFLALLNSTRYFAGMAHQSGGWRRFQSLFGPVSSAPRFVPHHLAHAISAYAFSGFNQAAVVVVDGRGAWEASSIWHGRDGRLEHVLTIPWPNSLGMFYAEFTEYLGFQKYSDEWKVMGLAPYGSPGIDLSHFIIPDDTPYEVFPRRLMKPEGSPTSEIESRLGPRRNPESEIDTRHKDVAFAVQQACEQAMIALVRVAIEKTRCSELCLAGGVALNSRANGRILTSGLVRKFFIQPAAGDEGVCLGAVLAPSLDRGGKLPLAAMRHAYLGPEIPESEIRQAISIFKLRAAPLPDPAVTAAELLAAGKILGWFQGRMEFGPRALGARSILADPRDPEMNLKVNNAVKFREWWRPFAPSVLAEAADQYFESAHDSPFMILTSLVRPEMRSVIPAVTHVDGSARPQTVTRDANPLYHRLISEFGARTGVPVLLNTSFNVRGEAIVHSPADAVRTFFSSGMDALVIGNFLIEK